LPAQPRDLSSVGRIIGSWPPVHRQKPQITWEFRTETSISPYQGERNPLSGPLFIEILEIFDRIERSRIL